MPEKEATVFEKCKQKIEAQRSVNLHLTHILINRTIVFLKIKRKVKGTNCHDSTEVVDSNNPTQHTSRTSGNFAQCAI
jgi:hypothetical protein